VQTLSLRSLASRRRFLGTAGAATLTLSPLPAFADAMIRLPLPGGPDERSITTAFPQKGALILQRTRPPLLETPFEVFDQSVFTPNDKFFVSWHWANIPGTVDVNSFRLAVHGHVNQSLSLSLVDLLAFPRITSWRSTTGRKVECFSPERYVDGVRQELNFTGTVPATTANNSSIFDIGRYLSRDNSVSQGNIDDVRIYNRALSATEVKQLYNAGR
jgi:hypothetical protein